MMPIPMPESPWLSVAVDLCGSFPIGETLLILVDYSSRFPFVGILKSTTYANISKLFKIFSEHGLPETLGDNLTLKILNFLKSMVLPIIDLHRYDPKQIGKLSQLIALLRKLYNMLLTKDVIGNMNWIRFC